MASFLKLSTLIGLASILSTTLATPPACLLACVSQVEKSSNCDGLNDLSCVCGNLSSDVEQCLKDHCPNGDADDAASAFKSSCGSQYSSNSSSSSSAFSSTQASSSSSASESSSSSSSVEASSTEESSSSAPSSSSEYVAPSSSAVESTSSEAESSSAEPSSTVAAESSTLQTSSVSQETSSSESAQPVVTQSEEAGAVANKVGLGAVVGLIGAALL